MRFLLDNDVDAALVGLLTRAGHQAWTAWQAGLAGVESAEDDAVSVYAHDKVAVVITHDAEFTARRRRNTFGQHVWLRCEHPDAFDVVETHLPTIIGYLDAVTTCVMKVSRKGVEVYPPRWE